MKITQSIVMDKKTKKRLRAIRDAEERLAFASPKTAGKLTEKIAKWKADLFH